MFVCYNIAMLKNIKNTPTYQALNLNSNLTSTYLFYSSDKVFNDNIALSFAKSIMCQSSNACGHCSACSQFDSKTNPDLVILDQDSIKVEDVNNLMSKLSTKPLSYSHKVFVILNADKVNEIAQNKLLKSLEEPNGYNIFILTTTKMDKILPTVLSRLKKIFVPKLSDADKQILAKENAIISRFYGKDITLTEIMNSEETSYLDTLNTIKNIFTNLNTTADIPKVVNNIKSIDKTIFFSTMQDIFLDIIKGGNKYSSEISSPITAKFTTKALIKCVPLIDDSYKKQMSNVNFNYILDNLLFNILKEKFLCR